MSTIYLDREVSDEERRQALYDGDLFVYSPTPETVELCALARSMLEEAFAPHDPRKIHQHLTMEQCAAVLSRLKPAFIHHPQCKVLLPRIIAAVGRLALYDMASHANSRGPDPDCGSILSA
jgi:hypothetical protein